MLKTRVQPAKVKSVDRGLRWLRIMRKTEMGEPNMKAASTPKSSWGASGIPCMSVDRDCDTVGGAGVSIPGVGGVSGDEWPSGDWTSGLFG